MTHVRGRGPRRLEDHAPEGGGEGLKEHPGEQLLLRLAGRRGVREGRRGNHAQNNTKANTQPNASTHTYTLSDKSGFFISEGKVGVWEYGW